MVARLITALGVDVNQAVMDDGATPLCVAVYNGHLDVVERLLAAPGVDANLARWDGTTPMFIVLACGHTVVVQKLRAAGATEPHG